MNLNLNKTQQFLVFTSSILTSLAIGISPTQAATLALSGGLIGSGNFNQTPLNTQTLKHKNTLENFSPESSGYAQAQAKVDFKINASVASSSLSLAFGQGTNYFSLAQSSTTVISDFFVNASSSFFFEFMTELNLIALSDNPQKEKTKASGVLSLLLLDTTDKANQKLLDFLTVSGDVNSFNNQDFLKLEKSSNINLTQDLRQTSFGGNEEFAFASFQGSVQRFFTTPTSLTLIQVQTNEATVSTPEYSSILGLLIIGGLSSLGLKASRSGGSLKSKRTV